MDDQHDGSDLDESSVLDQPSQPEASVLDQGSQLESSQLEASQLEASEPDASEREATPRPSMARISISLPRSLYRDIRLHALDLDTTLSALLVRLIRQELKLSSPE